MSSAQATPRGMDSGFPLVESVCLVGAADVLVTGGSEDAALGTAGAVALGVGAALLASCVVEEEGASVHEAAAKR
ncbi:unnamed protein product, partial [Closterium sp. NIES-54]